MSSSGPFETAVRQAATLRETAHRSWSPPRRQWLMGQTWLDLLFAHWPLPHQQVQEHVPGLPVDTYDGQAWLSVTPFVLTGLRLAGTPPAPGISTFPETNVRTYVTLDGKPGIFFFSLDAASRLAVAAARRLYHLPYFRARMSARKGAWIEYETRRVDPGEPAELRGRYRGVGRARQAIPGTLDYFLTERYCLYTVGPSGDVYRGEIHHPPWPLKRAEARFDANTMPPSGLDLPDAEPVLHFAERQDVLIWSLERVGETRFPPRT